MELLPLTDEQILILARGRGIERPEELLSAIRAKHAQDFARRPQDLIELCIDWREHRVIRPHLEQVRTHVEDQLGARANRREKAELPVEKARIGAQRLALAAMLSRRLAVRYSTEADLHGSGEVAIDPRSLLTQWTAREISTLLERPLFAAAGYGRVRFRHRSVLEYLAACAIADLVDSGKLSLSASYRLIFGFTDRNERVLKPAMRPVAGWLARLHQSVFDEVVKVEPSTLLIHGDPESLTDRQRERALLGFVRAYGQGNWRGLRVPELQIQRLAQPSLAKSVLEAWSNGVENPEVRYLLIQLVSIGKFAKCADLMFSIASGEAYNLRERFDAIAALASLGDTRAPTFIEASLVPSPNWSADLALWSAISLYPDHVTDMQLLRIVAQLPVKTRRASDNAGRITARLETAEVSITRLKAVLSGLPEQTKESIVPVEDELRDKRDSMGVSPLLTAVAVRLLQAGIVDLEVLRAAVLGIRVSDTAWRRPRIDELRQLLHALPYKFRQEICLIDLRCLVPLKLGHPSSYLLGKMIWKGPIDYDDKDLPWMIAVLSDTSTPIEHRQGLLELSVYAATYDGKTSRTMDLQAAVADSPVLLAQLVETVAAKKPSEKYLGMVENERKRKEEQSKKQLKKPQTGLNFGVG